MNTICSFLLDSSLITASVKVSQPFFWCEPGAFACTVNAAFSKKTPCLAQGSKLPDRGG